MQVNLTGRHGTIHDDDQTYIKSKAEKLLTYFERVTQIDVTVSFENSEVEVELLVDTEHRHNLVASARGEEASQTFDAALHKMEQQIRKYKEKLQDHRRDVPMSG